MVSWAADIGFGFIQTNDPSKGDVSLHMAGSVKCSNNRERNSSGVEEVVAHEAGYGD